MSDDDKAPDDNGDRAVIREAKERYTRCEAYESYFRKNFIDDIKFCNGDSRNNYQWPEDQRTSRRTAKKPHFTINKTRQHCLQIINDMRQNKQAISIKATGGGASYKSAQIFEGMVRHIEYQSSAQNVYTTAARTQVEGGIGYWRVVTDYVDDKTFDQEIFIRRIKDPLSVYLDPSCVEADRSDAKFGFVFDTLQRAEAEKKWPALKAGTASSALGNDGEVSSWVGEDTVRVAEYFRRLEAPDELVAVEIDGAQVVEKMSALAADERFAGVKKGDLRKVLEEAGAQFRDAPSQKVEWYKIAGDQIVDRREWPGKYIPIVMLIGEETTIDGRMDRKGHTRALLDPQRNYNYWSSEAAAQVALQTKSPYIAGARSIEGQETYWKNANVTNYSVLIYNDVDDDGNKLEKPERSQPPVMAQAYIQGVAMAAEDLRLASGQYQASVGAPGNETSGIAIEQRQRQGENATYHYIDHEANAIRYTGRIILDLIPKVYDTKRVIKIMAENGDVTEATLDPGAQEAYFEHEQQEADEVKAIFNPNVGRYDVQADVGPSFATQRQEAFNAISEILKQSPALVNVIGDLLMQSADFPLADEMAERLKRGIPAEYLDKKADPQVQQMQQQMNQAQQIMQAMTQKISDQERELKAKDDGNTIRAYEAETKRIDSVADYLAQDPEALRAFIMETLREATALGPPDTPQGTAQPTQPPQPPQGGFSMPETQDQPQ